MGKQIKRVRRLRAWILWACASGAIALGASAEAGQLYWDVNGTSAGATDDINGTAGGTWSASSSNWNLDATGVAAPGSWVDGEIAVFSAGTNAASTSNTTTVDIASGYTPLVGGMIFEEGRVWVGTGRTIRMDAATITQSASGESRINAAIQGAGELTVNGNGGSLLFLAGVISDFGGQRSVRMIASPSVTLATSAQHTYTGGTIIDGSNVAVTTNSTVSAGTLISGGFGTGTLTLTSGSLRPTSSGDITVANAVDLAGDFTFGNGASAKVLTFSGPLTLTGDRVLTFGSGSNAATVFSGSVGGAFGFTKAGNATLQLAGANTFTGGVTVNGGAMVLTHADALGADGGTNTVSTGRIELRNNVNISGESLTIVGDGSNGYGALQTSSGDNTWAGGITLGNAGRIGADNGTLTVSGVIADGDASELNIRTSDTGAVILSGANSYTGRTVIHAGTLKLGAANAVPGGIVVLGNVGDFGATATFDLNGYDSSIGILNDAGSTMGRVVTNIGAQDVTLTVNNSAAHTYGGAITNGANKLHFVKNNDGAFTISGAISTTGNITLNAGALVLTGDNSGFTGNITVAGGVLKIGHSNALGDTAGTTTVTNTSARIEAQGGITVAENIRTPRLDSLAGHNVFTGDVQNVDASQLTLQVNADSLTLAGLVDGAGASDGNHTVNLNGAGNGLITGHLAGVYGIVKNHSGTWTLAGTVDISNMSTGVTVAAGKLLVNTTASGNKDWTVNTGGTLGGTGTIGAPLVTVNGILSPGASIESLDVVGNLTLNGTLLSELDGTGAGSADFLNVSGALTLGAASTLDLSILTTLDDAVYVLAQYGSRSGTFDQVLGDYTGYELMYDYNGNQIALVSTAAIPEPATLGVLLTGAMALIRRRR